ncbi:MAG: DUF3015 domain-containing protein [Desulfobacterales bacterium]|nr:DUF3015 domain-containing protein [Desulfobacterales bacterium]
MKKIIITLAISLLVVSAAYAGATRDNCGCGIGSMAFGENEGLVFQVLAVTTNASCGNQTFGISSGTLGCERANSVVRNEKVNTFVAENMDNLATDIASGQGETLGALADLIQVPENNRTKLFASLQNNFEKIYSSPKVTHEQVVEKIAQIVEQI